MNLELTDHRLSVLVKEKYLVGFAFLSEHHDYQDRETFHLNMRSSESFINIVPFSSILTVSPGNPITRFM